MNLQDAMLQECCQMAEQKLKKCTSREQQEEVIKQKFMVGETIRAILHELDLDALELQPEEEVEEA